MLALTENMPQFEAALYEGGWPADPTAFDNADAVVVYCDGGGRHLLNEHLEEFDKLMKKGVGLACIHYGVEVPKGPSGEKFLEWIGGYFEPYWSVNPHWTAQFKKLNNHEITQGVKPFEINDEWYYHMRFRPNMKDVTPILSAIPPKETLSRPDGAHSNNEHVRKTLGQPQHLAWAATREDGGRGFGFTGGHHHWNWADDNFRKLVLNAIVWIAKEEVPADGVSSDSLTKDDLEGLIGGPPPEKKKPTPKKKTAAVNKSEASFTSKVVTPKTPGHSVDIDVDITGAKELYLLATDAGNGYSYDWANWVEPKLVGPKGEKKLTDLKWKSASTQWGSVNVGKNAGGDKLSVDNKPVAFGIGTHANSLIAFDLPAGYTRFKAKGAIDTGGVSQPGGSDSSVQFLVFTKKPSAAVVAAKAALSAEEQRKAENAVSGLKVHDDLVATLSAAEPDLKSITNIDVDHRGRIWVCDVMNYRRNNGSRPEGDRILILEDTNGDGISDKTIVYYQGRDVDSAMGICVLGNKVIVSATPNIIVFTDLDGDDKPDKKEMLFTNTGQPQHDHSAHSFSFGPDGKLYWNVGNTGKYVHDKDGKPVVDLAGNTVIDNGKPYIGGMPFRCNMDGSDFEVLAHNFRNNYEVAVDSFGTLWQSDNDDDGNRGVRINYVMQYGNYGYRDQMTGAGWKVPRTNMEKEVPLQHWHLNDPGVVPNLIQTYAGSPTGICVYEGRLLPKVFWDQVIHCDAGPNIVRAYPAKNDGAGYSAEIVDVLHGENDNWFRPADVCVAPDGSLFISDWYDPGVGGHAQRDLDRGRLFRVAPKGSKYTVPKYDFDSIEGAIEALASPNGSARYMAWTALHQQGSKAESALLTMYQSNKNPRLRARALWLLSKIEGRGTHYVETALKDKDANIRITGLRLAHQLQLDPASVVSQVVNDRSVQVRREAAIALRFSDSSEANRLWAQLAAKHDGKDRWYLEALGIGADLHWDARLDAYLAQVGNKLNTTASRDIVWRSRAAKTTDLLVIIINQDSTSAADLPRYFRAFDFQANGDTKNQAMAQLAFSDSSKSGEAASFILGEAIKRLGRFDIQGDKQKAAALEKALTKLQGTSQYVQLVSKFDLKNHYPTLLKMAQAQPGSTLGVEAVRVLLDKKQFQLLNGPLYDNDIELAIATATAMGNSASGGINGLMLPLVKNNKLDVQLRRIAVKALATNKGGAEQLMKLVKAGTLDSALQQATAVSLSNVIFKEIRAEAQKLFPAPPSKDNKPIPAISELVKQRGSVATGKKIFETTGTCNKCHIVNKQGKDVGPDLSEIGSKLSREAFFESVLYPSAGISHNYENWAVLLDNGTAVSGLKTSETADSVTIKNQEGLSRTFNKDEVEELKMLSISVMPNDLQKLITIQELVDVVDYLSTLKKK